MHVHKPGLTRLEFLDASGLKCKALDRFIDLGYVKPFAVGSGLCRTIYYPEESAEFIRTMLSFLDGRRDLQTAYASARDAMTSR